MDTVLRLLGTYEIILKRKNHQNTMFQFYYIGDGFLVLRESGIFLKLLCTEWKIVHYQVDSNKTKNYLNDFLFVLN